MGKYSEAVTEYLEFILKKGTVLNEYEVAEQSYIEAVSNNSYVVLM